MSRINAFATPEYPVLFSVVVGTEDGSAVPPGHAGISLALLVDGVPSFLATHVIPEERVTPVVTSLEEGDVRVAVVGLAVELEEDVPELGLEARAEHPAAFVSVVCADGRRLTVARILSRDPERSAEQLARYVVREISRGAQIPDLAATG